MNKLFIQIIVATCLSFLSLRGMDRVEFEKKQRLLSELIKEANSTPIHPFSSTELYNYNKNTKEFTFKGKIEVIDEECLKKIRLGEFIYIPFHRKDSLSKEDIGIIVAGCTNSSDRDLVLYLIESLLISRLIDLGKKLENAEISKYLN